MRQPDDADADVYARSGRARNRGADCYICADRGADCFANAYDCADPDIAADHHGDADQHADIDAAESARD